MTGTADRLDQDACDPVWEAILGCAHRRLSQGTLCQAKSGSISSPRGTTRSLLALMPHAPDQPAGKL